MPRLLVAPLSSLSDALSEHAPSHLISLLSPDHMIATPAGFPAGAFQTLLCYKAVEAGSQVTFVNPAYTSQLCSACGAMVDKALSVRVHHCPSCLLDLDRDLNAALRGPCGLSG